MLPDMTDPLAEAFDGLLETLGRRAVWLQHHPFYDDAENRPGAYSFLLAMLLTRIEEEVVFDPDFPTFRIVDPRIREGGDNPDQRYLISRVNGGETYRIFGRVGGERRVELQIYAGDPYVFGRGGRSAGFLAFEDLDVGPDGTFEVIASPTRQPGNWIENPPDGTRILVRQVYGEWTDGDMGEVHIDRVGHEGDLKPALTEQEMVARLRAATASLDTHVEVWPEMIRNFYLEGQPANQLCEPFDPGSLGGVSGRFMAHGTWDLADDEALVVTTWPASGDYQGIQLADLWWSSLEYANRQTSLTADQAAANPDGSFTFVIAGRDPGVANWLDTVDRRRGVIMLRFDGTTETTFPPEEQPVVATARLDELDAVLGPDVPRVTPEQRRAAIAGRRRHVQVRFGT